MKPFYALVTSLVFVIAAISGCADTSEQRDILNHTKVYESYTGEGVVMEYDTPPLESEMNVCLVKMNEHEAVLGALSSSPLEVGTKVKVYTIEYMSSSIAPSTSVHLAKAME